MTLPPNTAADLIETGPPLIGAGRLMRLAYAGGDTNSVWDGLRARTRTDPADAAAWMDISVLMLAGGEREKALEIQKAAIALQPVYRRIFGNGESIRIAAFVAPGDMMANTPIDFLLEGSDATLFYVYVDATTERLPEIPAIDAAFMAVGQSPENEAVLANLARLLGGWSGPHVVNGAPLTVAGLTRDGVHQLLADAPAIVSPKTVRVDRDALLALAGKPERLAEILPGTAFPLVVRPAGTHAGGGMEKIDDADQLTVYIEDRHEPSFYLCPFIDYAGSDGLYRKQRVVFIAGKPFASHYAVSGHWMVHYLSAGMMENAGRRAEEADWMARFDEDFAKRHATAFAMLTQRVGLDYFGIDCAEMPDGRLLVFEIDVAMIVHDMDSETIFPYKKPAMRKLFGAFQQVLTGSAAGRGRSVRQAPGDPA